MTLFQIIKISFKMIKIKCFCRKFSFVLLETWQHTYNDIFLRMERAKKGKIVQMIARLRPQRLESTFLDFFPYFAGPFITVGPNRDLCIRHEPGKMDVNPCPYMFWECKKVKTKMIQRGLFLLHENLQFSQK